MSPRSSRAYWNTSSAKSDKASTPSRAGRGGSCLQTAPKTWAAAPWRADRPQAPGAGAGWLSTASTRRQDDSCSNRARMRLASSTWPASFLRRLPECPRPPTASGAQNRGSGKRPRASPKPGVDELGILIGGSRYCESGGGAWAPKRVMLPSPTKATPARRPSRRRPPWACPASPPCSSGLRLQCSTSP